MALNEAEMQARLDSEIYSNLKAIFSPDVSRGQNYEPIADDMLHKLATAIANGVAKVMYDEIVNKAEVIPGQDVVGNGGGVPGPVYGVTVTPGHIK